MDLDVAPEPSPAERSALDEALRRIAFTREDGPVSAWWSEGVRENVLEDDEEKRASYDG
jgi:hypothetical protein